MVFNGTFNTISVMSWWSVVLVETGIPGYNDGSAKIKDWATQTPLKVWMLRICYLGNCKSCMSCNTRQELPNLQTISYYILYYKGLS